MDKINILLLRGLTREARHWGDFPDQLKNLDCVNTVNCIDLPGAGVRYGETSPLSIDAYVDDLREKLKSDNDGRPWAVLAISMGAMIAMQWCKKYPDDFKYLIVINMSAKNLANPLKRLSLGTVGFIFKSLYDQSVEQREQGIKNLTTNINMDNDIVKKWIAYAHDCPVSIPNFFRQITAAAQFKAPNNLEVATLILASENDHLAHVSNSKNLAKKLKNSVLKLHNIAGHDLPLDDPKWVIEQTNEFLREKAN